MSGDGLPDDWAIIRSWLPDDLDARAQEHGFISRNRGLTDAELWLRLILMHVAGGLSLEQTAMRARELGLAEVSGVALFKRLKRAECWLRNLCQYMLSEQQRRVGQCAWPSGYRVRAIDGSDIKEPGDTGSAWRIHYSIQLPELVCDHVELTSIKGGEGLGRFEFAKNDLVLADRGYSHRSGAAKVIDSGATLLLRWNPYVLPVTKVDGDAFDLLGHCRALQPLETQQWEVAFTYAGKHYPVRICAMRKSRTAAERARKKALEKSRRNQSTPRETSLELTAYILVLTTLPEKYRAAHVLDYYRCRWQVELAFKRLKSLLEAGHVPKSDERSARAWMQAKILTALMMERLLLEARVFSPWGYRLRRG